MLIGVPKEIKNHEYRIGLTPAGVRELEANGHQVIVQHDGGKSIGLTDEMYRKAGAEIWESAADIFARADMIIKVKEFVDARLRESAVSAVKLWRYQPTLLNGNPVEVTTQIEVNFTLVK